MSNDSERQDQVEEAAEAVVEPPSGEEAAAEEAASEPAAAVEPAAEAEASDAASAAPESEAAEPEVTEPEVVTGAAPAAEPVVVEPVAAEADPLFLDDDDEEEVVVVEAAVDTTARELEELRARNEELRKESKELKNRLLRAAADFENFRKRSAREKEEQRKFGSEKILSEFLPIVDNLERAVAHAESAGDGSSLVEGVRMVLKQFQTALHRHGVEGFEALHQRFDPERHEAVQQVETDAHPGGTVIEVYQRGYFLHERLMRPALVVVSRHPNE